MNIPIQPVENRTVLCLLSGGWDSTYMYSNFLDANWSVTDLYIDIENNTEKSKRELLAISNIKNSLSNNIYAQQVCKTAINATNNLALSQIIPLLSSLATTVRNEKYVAIGYVIGDDAISFLDEITALWNSLTVFLFNKPQLIFPLKQTSKITIYNYLREKKLLEHTTYCESESIIDNNHCGKCIPCMKVDMLKKIHCLNENYLIKDSGL